MSPKPAPIPLADRLAKLPPYLFAEIDRNKREARARGVETREHGRLHCVRQPLQRALLQVRAHQLAGIEGVALRAFGHELDYLRRVGVEEVAHQVAGLGPDRQRPVEQPSG